ncbi:MAG TPA: acetyl/propionyl/methylcrotonyl-CoA carboxylase subunit alpha [Gammaproteobacteria bacterium]|nr:acetyl/propionyl/methylcrotonyl-CoA carboxylase subunit alpha [Gammaproteobacteria bacterium]
MFKKILIANRGEIACRIIDTCQRLGVKTVAVYSDADKNARHVRLADEAVHIGGAAAAESYLKIDAIVAAAKDTGADAIHPGFGFLSERADFVDAVENAGLVFIGPTGKTMQQMGAKDAAKALMEKANVPVVPGYHGKKQDTDFLAKEADKIGYPLMIKASAGGGGKGMRIVNKAADFADALDSAKRESKSAFGDDHVLLERFVEGPRHIEFQVMGDTHGNVVHLFERECSIQRRYQKIIEETPSPFLDDATRKAMGDAAVAAAKAVDYVNAGTVEFIVGADKSFYFMEMNTRLQVEHPVTELTTGLDLVEWQLRVAAGETLPLQQSEIDREGHAIEVRLYAENPQNDFLPSVGTLQAFITPDESENFRLDTGVESGDEISIHYDPMIAKLIVWDDNRPAAIKTLQSALAQTAVFGVTTNLPLLRRIANNNVFASGDIDTRYIDTHLADLLETEAAPAHVLDAVALDYLLDETEFSGWERADGFQLNGFGGRRIVLRDAADNETTRFVGFNGDNVFVHQNNQQREAQIEQLSETQTAITCDGCKRQYHVLRLDDRIQISYGENTWLLTRLHPFAAQDSAGANDTHPGSPMPGRIVKTHVKAGDTVDVGTPLLVLEGMKMEYTLKAAVAGTVDKVLYNEGDMVDAETPLVDIKPKE